VQQIQLRFSFSLHLSQSFPTGLMRFIFIIQCLALPSPSHGEGFFSSLVVVSSCFLSPEGAQRQRPEYWKSARGPSAAFVMQTFSIGKCASAKYQVPKRRESFKGL